MQKTEARQSSHPHANLSGRQVSRGPDNAWVRSCNPKLCAMRCDMQFFTRASPIPPAESVRSLNADMEKFRSFPSPAFLLANVGPGPSRPSSHGQANRILAKAAEIGFALQCSFLSERFRETRKAAGYISTRESRNLL